MLVNFQFIEAELLFHENYFVTHLNTFILLCFNLSTLNQGHLGCDTHPNTTWCHDPEDLNSKHHHRESLKTLNYIMRVYPKVSGLSQQ
jgi:hypothetical protein